MKAAVVKVFGTPPIYDSFPEPSTEEGEIAVKVTAAGLHPVVKALSSGSHYGSTGTLPLIPGLDGTGTLADGGRVYFGGVRPPYGTMAERAVARTWMCVPLPDGLEDTTAAAIVNPGMSSWGALKERAKFSSGENILILGATGVAGKLAVQIANHLGAKRVIAAGRNLQALERTRQLGADAVIPLEQPHSELVASFRKELTETGIDVVLDYLWGNPAEAFFEAVSQKGMKQISPRIRFVQVGESAGRTVSLAAATLRSSGLELIGSGFGSTPLVKIMESVRDFLHAAAGGSFRIDVKTAPLTDIESLWNSDAGGARLVFQP